MVGTRPIHPDDYEYDTDDDTAPAFEDCEDCVDNDLNGLLDCADPQCASYEQCIGGEICDDGIDNDGDLDIDSADAECHTYLTCSEGECADGLDNNGGGGTDCADPSCCREAVCSLDPACEDVGDDDDDSVGDDDDSVPDPCSLDAMGAGDVSELTVTDVLEDVDLSCFDMSGGALLITSALQWTELRTCDDGAPPPVDLSAAVLVLNEVATEGCEGEAKIVFAGASPGTPLYVGQRIGACGGCPTPMLLGYAYSVPTSAESLELLDCESCGDPPGDDDDSSSVDE